MIKNIILVITCALSITAIVLCLVGTKNETVFVDTSKLYSEFTLSKELNTELEGVLNNKKKGLDSLYEYLRISANNLKFKDKRSEAEIKAVARLEEDYVYRQRQFEKESQELTVNYNSKIWNQINQYIDDYGKQQNYLLVLGATGEGNIMFGNKKADVTNAVIEYINNKYANKEN